jgi:aspartate/methionine/tyrosine aminotransferase
VSDEDEKERAGTWTGRATDFSLVVEALELHTRTTGQEPLSISGWGTEDEAIRPPEELVTALEALPMRLRNYTYLRDLREAKERAAALFRTGVRLGGDALTASHVTIVPNSTQALLLTLAALRDQGVERIIVAAPVYFSAVEVAHRLGLLVSIIPATDFVTGALDLEALAQAMTWPRSALLLTNPAYSIGVEYDWPTVRALFDAAPQGQPIILDETRMGLHWQRVAPWYNADFPPQAIVIRSPSKIFFVSGAKTSLIFATPTFLRRVEALSESLLGSVSGALEETALAYLRCLRRWHAEARRSQDGPLLGWRRCIVSRLEANLDYARPTLERNGFQVSPINSGPYALAARRTNNGDTMDCARLAAAHGALAMSAEYFFHQRPGWMGLRLNLGVPGERLTSALERLAR